LNGEGEDRQNSNEELEIDEDCFECNGCGGGSRDVRVIMRYVKIWVGFKRTSYPTPRRFCPGTLIQSRDTKPSRPPSEPPL
jgi:hypothetical protein